MNYFALKIILLNILQNLASYLFKHSVSHIIIISRNDTFFHTTGQIKFPCEAQFYEMLSWHQSRSNGQQIFEWLIVLCFQFGFLAL